MAMRSIPEGKEFLPNVTIRKLRSIANKEQSEKYKRHFNAAVLRKEGKSINEISDELDMSRGTISIWLKNMTSRGVGEEYKLQQGRPPKFTSKQLKELEKDMKKSPEKYNIDSNRWTSEVVTDYVLQKFDIQLTPGSMRRILVRQNINWPGSAANRAKKRRKKS